jgi:tRNA 2-thiouridine synthesizing protein A
MSETVVDTRGLQCPLPVLRARKAMRELAGGSLVRILATDPGAVRDVAAMCAATGDALLESRVEDGELSFLVRKAG